VLIVDDQNSRFLDCVHSLAPSKISEAEWPIIAEGAGTSSNSHVECTNYSVRPVTESNFQLFG
jgi:hypothetical protein